MERGGGEEEGVGVSERIHIDSTKIQVSPALRVKARTLIDLRRLVTVSRNVRTEARKCLPYHATASACVKIVFWEVIEAKLLMSWHGMALLPNSYGWALCVCCAVALTDEWNESAHSKSPYP